MDKSALDEFGTMTDALTVIFTSEDLGIMMECCADYISTEAFNFLAAAYINSILNSYED